MYENKLDGSVYVGQTVDMARRDQNHIYPAKRTTRSHIDNAIKKHGRENFELHTFKIVETQEEADQEEIYWISELRISLGSELVYNIANGGRCGWLGKKHKESTKKKMSDSIKEHQKLHGHPARGKRRKNAANITFHKKSGKWQAHSYGEGTTKYLGLHLTKEDATAAVLEFRKKP